MYIDNTYISSLDELKEIIESHTINGKADDEFRTEFIETFEDNTETGLLAFAESIDTEEAKKYAEHLAAQEAKWDSLSASEQYAALVAFFNVTPIALDLTKYIEITNVELQDNEEVVSVNIAVKVKKPANESIRFGIKLYDRDDNVVRTIQTEYQSLAVRTNQELKFKQQIEANENYDKVEVIVSDRIITTESVGRSRKFSIYGVEFTMIRVKGGTFTMGGTAEQGSDCNENEKPAHPVTLSDYYIGQTQVTQALWKAVMGTTIRQQRDKANKNELYGEGDNYPMYYISWDECQQFVKKLNSLLSAQLGDKRFALPTEAQWEYAARGGKKSQGYKYSGSDRIDEVAWFFENCNDTTLPVAATKHPNELDIYDMSGNVWEWCQDWYGSYNSLSQTNPTGASSGFHRVGRGGSWRSNARYCCVSYRDYWSPEFRIDYIGFRLVCF